MSWKAVELQVALPRTQDVGKLQDQMQQRGNQMQQSLAQSQLQSDQLKRKQVGKQEQKDDVNVKDEDENLNQPHVVQHRKEEEKSQKIIHPYLGNQIDYSG